MNRLTPRPREDDPANPWLEEVLASVSTTLQAMKFGTVTLTVHEGRVVQIEVTEKRRLGH